MNFTAGIRNLKIGSDLVEVLEPGTAFRWTSALFGTTSFLLRVEILLVSHHELTILVVEVRLLRRRLLLYRLLDLSELERAKFLRKILKIQLKGTSPVPATALCA